MKTVACSIFNYDRSIENEFSSGLIHVSAGQRGSCETPEVDKKETKLGQTVNIFQPWTRRTSDQATQPNTNLATGHLIHLSHKMENRSISMFDTLILQILGISPSDFSFIIQYGVPKTTAVDGNGHVNLNCAVSPDFSAFDLFEDSSLASQWHGILVPASECVNHSRSRR